MDSIEFDALEDQAYKQMSPGAAAFCECGADDEVTVAENTAAWRNLRLRPRVLRDISNVETATKLLGAPTAMPIMVAPMGRHLLFHPEGECATARGAAQAGAAFTVPCNSTVTIEDIAEERIRAPQWFQLYLPPDRLSAEPLIDRLAEAGYRAIVLTVDQPVAGWSPRAARSPVEPSPAIRHVNLPGAPIARTAYDPAQVGVINYPTTFQDLEWLVRRAPIDVIVKGILRGDDASRCVDAGAKAIIVSNHGGRHLDTAVATADALPDIVDAIKHRAEIYVDGGIRRGTDVLKALALGARAILVGRPVLWALSVHGADGVREVLEHLHAELVRSMILSGVSNLGEATPDLIVHPTSNDR